MLKKRNKEKAKNIDSIENIYFKDIAISDINDDELHHIDIADSMFNNIKYNSPPYNIALIGKWGTGKSSILKMLQQRLDKEKGYQFININAWKYEKEALRKSFVLKLIYELDKKINYKKKKSNDLLERWYDKVFDRFYNIKASISEDKFDLKKDIINTLIELPAVIIKIAVLVIVYSLIYIFLNKLNISIENFNNAVLSIIIMLVPIFIDTLYKYLDSRNKSTISGINIQNPIFGTEEYEKLLDDTIEEYKIKTNEENLRIICVVDDIDRLNAKKVVEALDAIKSFVDNPHIIFIVPYDVNILNNAINSFKLKDIQNDCELVEAELVLNKLFQYKFYMPELIKEDMYDYIIRLLDNSNCSARDIPKLFKGSFFKDRILSTLLSCNLIDTPRESKDIINTFIYKYLIATKRKGLELSDNDILMLAKLTVLESKYKEIYDYILDFPEILEHISDISDIRQRNPKFKIKDLYNNEKYNKEIVNLCIKVNDEKMKSLEAFLCSTSGIKVENVSKLIYLKNSDEEISHGKLTREFINDLKDNKYISAMDKIEGLNNVNKLIYNNINKGDGNPSRRNNFVCSTIQIYDKITGDRVELSKSIENYLQNHHIDEKEILKLDIISIMQILSEDKNYKNIKQILIKLLNEDISNIAKEEDKTEVNVIKTSSKIEYIISGLIKYIDIIDEELQITINKFIKQIYDNSIELEENKFLYNFHNLLDFIKGKVNKDIIYKILGQEYISKVILDLNKEKISNIDHVVDYYLENDDINNLVLELLNNIVDDKLLIDILGRIYNSLGDISYNTQKLIFERFEEIDYNDENISKDSEHYYGIVDCIISSFDLNKINKEYEIDEYFYTLTNNKGMENLVPKIIKEKIILELPKTLKVVEEDMTERCMYSKEQNVLFHMLDDNKRDLFIGVAVNYIDNLESNKKANGISVFAEVLRNKIYDNKYLSKVIISLIKKVKKIINEEKIISDSLLNIIYSYIYLCSEDTNREYYELILNDIYSVDKSKSINLIDNFNYKYKGEDILIILIKLFSDDYELKSIKNIIYKYKTYMLKNEKLRDILIEKFIEEYDIEEIDTYKELITIITEYESIPNEKILKIYNLFIEHDEVNVFLKEMTILFDKSDDKKELIINIVNDDYEIDLLINIIDASLYNWNSYVINEIMVNNNHANKIKFLIIIANLNSLKDISRKNLSNLCLDNYNSIDITKIDDYINVMIEFKRRRLINSETRKSIYDKLKVHINSVDNEDSKLKLNTTIEDIL